MMLASWAFITLRLAINNAWAKAVQKTPKRMRSTTSVAVTPPNRPTVKGIRKKTANRFWYHATAMGE